MNHPGPYYALIVAGGSGTRMGSELPKQFLNLAGTPILVHTLRAFTGTGMVGKIVLVLPGEHMDLGRKLAGEYFPGVDITIVEGGPSRTRSVSNGLHVLPDDGLVAIHDGARPLVSQSLIRACFGEAEKHGAAVPVVHIRDTVRQVSEDDSNIVDREMLRLVQTPQTFSLRIIKDAYRRAGDKAYPDDAAVITAAGYRFTFVDGEPANIKITTPEDLALAEALMNRLR